MDDLGAILTSPLTVLDPLRIAVILLVIGIGGGVKGAIGFGFPLVTTPVTSALWDVRHAVLLVSFASLVNNIGVVAQGGGSRRTFRRIVLILAGLSVGTIGGAFMLAHVPARALSVVVGTAALTFASIAVCKPDLAVPPRLERYLAMPMGLLGGLLGGATSISGPLVASYTHALRLSKQEFVFFLSLLYLVGASVQVISYFALGLYDAATLVVGVVSCVPNLLGVWLGLRVQARIDQELFRRPVVTTIGVSGAVLVARGIWGSL